MPGTTGESIRPPPATGGRIAGTNAEAGPRSRASAGLGILLRSPRVIIAEIALVAVVCAAGAALPQAGTATDAEMARFREVLPAVAALARALGLDHVFRSAWFLAPALLAAASLSLVVLGQLRRVRRLWSPPLTRAHFEAAPFRAEFERAARDPATPFRVWTERRFGLTGSLVFHARLLLVLIAGALQALFATGAAVDVLEGETLAPSAAAWEAQFPGLLARPFALVRPVTLREVRSTRYANGDLQSLGVRLAFGDPERGDAADLGVNRELRTIGGRLFLGSDFGPAALIEWQSPGGAPRRERVLLTHAGRGEFTGTSPGPDGALAHLRVRVDPAGRPATRFDIHAMKGPALLGAGSLGADESLALPGGATLTLHGATQWARLRGDRNPALGLAAAGLAMVLLGASIIFLVVRVDACVVVTPAGDRERVFVAMKPHRFSPLFQERFQRLLREQGAPA
jgi:hypothetical protein